MKVYVISLHDESWGNHGDYITHVFTDEEKAQEQADWLEENLSLLEGDGVCIEEFEVSEVVSHRAKGETVSGYIYNTSIEEEEDP